ncbi:MAG: hypothetical protein MW690_001156 [Methanophagales archaeon]|nr:hypothetical protein [Methanophagales archaeon]MCU4139224.1 hypothetical protein [Methanophagales archaeon]
MLKEIEGIYYRTTLFHRRKDGERSAVRGVGEANLTAREKLVLKALSAAGEALTPKEIAERTGLKEDAASQIAFILAEKGYRESEGA